MARSATLGLPFASSVRNAIDTRASGVTLSLLDGREVATDIAVK
jgi:hypothetical protein